MRHVGWLVVLIASLAATSGCGLFQAKPLPVLPPAESFPSVALPPAQTGQAATDAASAQLRGIQEGTISAARTGALAVNMAKGCVLDVKGGMDRASTALFNGMMTTREAADLVVTWGSELIMSGRYLDAANERFASVEAQAALLPNVIASNAAAVDQALKRQRDADQQVLDARTTDFNAALKRQREADQAQLDEVGKKLADAQDALESKGRIIGTMQGKIEELQSGAQEKADAFLLWVMGLGIAVVVGGAGVGLLTKSAKWGGVIAACGFLVIIMSRVTGAIDHWVGSHETVVALGSIGLVLAALLITAWRLGWLTQAKAQIVAGGEATYAALKANPTTAAVADAVWKVFTTEQQKAQDRSVQAAVDDLTPDSTHATAAKP
jgi:hypothetical protein